MKATSYISRRPAIKSVATSQICPYKPNLSLRAKSNVSPPERPENQLARLANRLQLIRAKNLKLLQEFDLRDFSQARPSKQVAQDAPLTARSQRNAAKATQVAEDAPFKPWSQKRLARPSRLPETLRSNSGIKTTPTRPGQPSRVVTRKKLGAVPSPGK